MKITINLHARLEIDTDNSHMLSPVPDAEELQDFFEYLLKASEDITIKRMIIDEQ